MDARLYHFVQVVVFSFFLVFLVPFTNKANSADWDSLKTHKFEGTAKPVLTVGGKVQGNKPIKFDLNDLIQLPSETFSVHHSVTGQRNQYTGILLDDFLDHLGIAPDSSYLIIRASNNYKSVVKIKDINRFEYLLSYKKNGKFYNQLPSDEDRGPLAIIINFDKHPGLDFDIYKHQLVWFVENITIE